ncbi:Receptor expression-enhancing protein [Dirofilaria immitis]
MIPLLIQQCQHLRRSVSLNLRKLFGGLIVGSLYVSNSIKGDYNKNRKKKGLTLNHKPLKKVQSSFWQALESKADEIKSLAPLKDTEEYYYSAQASPKHEEDSFVTSMTNLSLSFPIADKEKLISSRRQGSFDSGKGGSPPPPHIDILDLEVNDGAVPSTSLSHTPQKSSLELLNKETRSLRIILNELQSKTVSDDVKAKNLASLNRVILQCKDYMQRCSVRQDFMSLGLFKALPSLIESQNRRVESELEIFFASESNDNLVGSGTRHPIDVFQAAYVKLKHSTAAEILLDILELIAKIQPNGKRLRGVINYLQRGHLRSEGVQTETIAEDDSLWENAPSQDVTKFTNAQDHSVLNESSSMLQAIRRPRSTSRMKRRSESRKMEMVNIPFIDDDIPVASSNIKLDGRNEKSCNLEGSPKAPLCQPRIEKQSTEKLSIASIPPPPLVPPPAPEFLNPALLKQVPVTEPSVVVKSVSVYKKKCATNTVAWEAVKPEMVVTRSTIWSDQSGINTEFNQRERERLEKVFERAHACNSRIFATEKRTRNTNVRKKDAVVIGGLTEKRALNLGIVLARFRPLTLEQLVQKMQSLAISDLSLDYLASLLKHFPSPDELAYFAKMETANNLKDAELFCFLIARKPSLKLRIELKVLADNIVSDLARQLDCTHLLITATDELYNSASINIFFHRCLQYGNFLNQSTFAAGASGFALSSLITALNTKGNGAASNTRLVDVLAEYADESLRTVVKVLDFLEPAKKYSIDDLEKSEVSLRHSLEMSLKNLQECGDSELYAFYSPVIMDSTAKCGQLARCIQKVRHNENRLKEYYCASKLSLENILEILCQAVKLFQDSLIKAEARIARTQRLQQRRADAGHDIADDGRNRRQRRSNRTGTFEPPNPWKQQAVINGRRKKAFQQIEQKTHLEREKIVYAIIGVVGLYMVFGAFAKLVCNFIGFAYPAYASVKAIRTAQKDDDTHWLIYWTVFAAFSFIDFFAEMVLCYFPVYWIVKALFMLYLYLPQTYGALVLYDRFLDPAITKIDALMKQYKVKKSE